MIEVMKLGKLRTNREPSPLDDLTELEASLREEGLQVPLLVNGNFIVVDGVRRLAAIRRLGYKDAICQVTDDFNEAMENLAEGRKSSLQKKQSPSRVYGQYALIAVMGHQMQMQARGVIPTTGSRRGGNLRMAEPLPSSRIRYTELMDIKPHTLQNIVTMYNYLFVQMGRDNPKRKQFSEMLDRLDRGELSTSRVFNFYTQLKASEGGNGLSGAQQEQILTAAISSMEGLRRGLQDTLPLSSNVRRETVATYLKESRAFLTNMRVLNNEIERQLSE